MVMPGWAIEHLDMAGVELGTWHQRRPCKDILECERPARPVRRGFILRDPPDQLLAETLPLARLGPAQSHGETKYPTLPWSGEDDLAVLPWRRDRTKEIGVESGGLSHQRQRRAPGQRRSSSPGLPSVPNRPRQAHRCLVGVRAPRRTARLPSCPRLGPAPHPAIQVPFPRGGLAAEQPCAR